jgi:uncharacterized membrane protein YdjX (TVP38/TMEM64 family)
MDAFVFEGEETPMLLRKRVVGGLVIGFLALVGLWSALSSLFGVSNEIDAEPLQDWVDGLGPAGPLAFIGVMAVSVLFAPIPNAPIFLAAGLVWGAVLGTVYSVCGLMLGSVAAFYSARWLGRRWMPRLIGARATERLDAIAGRMGGRLIFWARLLPAVNFDWISFVAGVTAISFPRFVVPSLAGMIIPTAVFVVAGDGLGSDIRLTLGAGSFWLAGIVLSAAYFWWAAGRAKRARMAVPSHSGERHAEVDR